MTIDMHIAGTMLAVRAGTGLSLLETGFVAATFVIASWWVFARQQMPAALDRASLTVGALVTVSGSLRLSFSDSPAYLTPWGRHLLGHLPVAGIGPDAAGDMARTTADLVTSVMSPALDGPGRGDLTHVADRRPAVQINQTVTPRTSRR